MAAPPNACKVLILGTVVAPQHLHPRSCRSSSVSSRLETSGAVPSEEDATVGGFVAPDSPTNDGSIIDPEGLLEDPVWVALLANPVPGTAVVACRLNLGSFTTDMRSMGDRVRAAPSGSAVLVVADRRCLRVLLTHLRHPNMWMRALSIGQLEAVLQRLQVDVDSRMLVWPTAQNSRVLSTPDAGRVWKWAHRSGVLGGGGPKPMMRALFRSPLLTPLVRPLASGVALVGRKR